MIILKRIYLWNDRDKLGYIESLGNYVKNKKTKLYKIKFITGYK